MPSLLQNKYVRFGAFGFGLIILFAVILSLWQFISYSSHTSFSGHSVGSYGYAEAPAYDDGAYKLADIAMRGYEMESSYYPIPIPSPSFGYNNLETYETTDYRISARTKQFDELCSMLRNLKAEDRFDFRNLSENTNNCSATFYTAEENVDEVLGKLQSFSGVEVSRSTNSVTRQRDQLESQADILRQQLANVEGTLQRAEVQFDEIIAVARSSNNASELASAIREKLQMTDSLTQRKISLNNQLNNLLRQSQDLEERIGVVQFSVSVQRSIPVYPSQDDRKWEQAWKQLGDQFTETAIGLTAFLGVFLLYAVQGIIYLLIVIIIVRLLWKFVRLVWKKL